MVDPRHEARWRSGLSLLASKVTVGAGVLAVTDFAGNVAGYRL